MTWARAGVLLFFCSWLALGSAPISAVAMRGAWLDVAWSWIVWSFAMALCYGPPVLALVAVTRRPLTPSRRSVAHIACTVLAGGAYYALALWGAYYAPRHRDVTIVRLITLTLEGVVEIGVVGLLIVLLGRRDRATQALRQAELDRVALDRELAEARVMALQSQIEPHFLFNTLAKLRDPHSSLGRELALTTAYLSVQQVRMGDRLDVAVDVPARLAAASFPPMMLMTLVENAIKHGIAPMPQGGRVTICAAQDEGRLLVRVVDTGAGITSMKGAGIGIANTRARLQALFGASGRLRIGNNDSGGVTAAIELPLTFEAPA